MDLIDVHGHLSPLGEKGGGPPSLRDPEAIIARKRELGIGLTVIGSPAGAGSMAPVAGVDNYRQTADQVRAHNERMGELVDAFPGSLLAYAYLDPFGDDAMLGQAQDLLADRRFVGLVVNTSINGRYLTAPEAADFFAMADGAGATVLLHPPAAPVGAANLGHPGLIEHVGRVNDVTAGVASLVLAGIPARHPRIRLIAAAAGGALALLAEKLALAGGPDVAESLGRLSVDTSVPSGAALRANLAVFGADRIVLGTDAPPVVETLGATVALLEGLAARERERIGWRNAAGLLGIDDPAVAAGHG